jgi:hypothetical protein
VLLALVGLAIAPLGFLAANKLDRVTLVQATAAYGTSIEPSVDSAARGRRGSGACWARSRWQSV